MLVWSPCNAFGARNPLIYIIGLGLSSKLIYPFLTIYLHIFWHSATVCALQHLAPPIHSSLPTRIPYSRALSFEFEEYRLCGFDDVIFMVPSEDSNSLLITQQDQLLT
jgi:hypothetical protein